MVSYPGGKGRSGIGSKTRGFVRSFFLPTGGTEHPPGVGSPLYAGRMDGRPALFAYGGHNLLAMEIRDDDPVPAMGSWMDPWPIWLVPRPESTHKTAIAFREAVTVELMALGYTNTHAGWTIKNGRDSVECDIWMRLKDGT